jgi:hypothetical protein
MPVSLVDGDLALELIEIELVTATEIQEVFDQAHLKVFGETRKTRSVTPHWLGRWLNNGGQRIDIAQ